MSSFTELTDKEIKGFMEEISNMHSLEDFRFELNNVYRFLTKFTSDKTVIIGLS